MNENLYLAAVIAVSAIATFLTRSLPFYLFDKRDEPHPLLDFLRHNMPLMIMVVLVFYAIRDTEFFKYPYGLPEWIGIATAFGLHRIFKNALVSVIASTALYMFLTQKVFL
ncbi:MAG: AzlD domain-containing protein [Zoogloeaceae bacterium]|jgi:branched-subunit amino acid transport protein AzlD|nr:AzlD domain-containing protein [Zoogloeaceae bacterium]